jgi:hypothetical protein
MKFEKVAQDTYKIKVGDHDRIIKRDIHAAKRISDIQIDAKMLIAEKFEQKGWTLDKNPFVKETTNEKGELIVNDSELTKLLQDAENQIRTERIDELMHEQLQEDYDVINKEIIKDQAESVKFVLEFIEIITTGEINDKVTKQGQKAVQTNPSI